MFLEKHNIGSISKLITALILEIIAQKNQDHFIRNNLGKRFYSNLKIYLINQLLIF